MERSADLLAALTAAPDVAVACQAAVEHLADDPHLLPSVYLMRGERLRCVAVRGYWQVRDGMPPSAGLVGRTYRGGREIVVHDVAGHPGYLEASPDVVAEACVPVVCGDHVAGVVNVESAVPLTEHDVQRVRACARALGDRIAALGGPPDESAAERLLRHLTHLTELPHADAIAQATLAAALDVVPLDSAMLVRRDPRHGLRLESTAGPLGDVLRGAAAELLPALSSWVAAGASSYTVGLPGDAAPADLAALRRDGVEALVALQLAGQGEPLGLLLVAATTPVRLDTGSVALLELLAAHAGSCLRNADLLRSLREQAATDPLTGLGHHATFHEALRGSHRRPTTAVVLVDLDGFKRLNDSFGHQHGDDVLRAVARALGGALRRGDRLFRVGGDEFAALLLVEHEAEALEVGDRLHEAVNAAALGVTVSIGVAVPHEDEDDGSVLARADRALYRVKADGRDGVALANDEPLPVAPTLG